MEAGKPVTILDVRWQLSEPDWRTAYEAGDIPGSVYVSLEDELTDHRITGRGRHPPPSGRAVEAAASRWGIRRGCRSWCTTIGTAPVPLWRGGLVTAAGIPEVRMLDGGLGAWIAAGGALETGPVSPDPAATSSRSIRSPVISPERRICRVPAYSPTTVLLNENDLLHLLPERRANGDVGVYCGSGVTAVVLLATPASAGIDAALYPGSWSEWSSDPSRPVARGPN
jgi:thiosulfate/3-mercaptopyruvate sulfurtransferase